jgi:hypothetical protein
VDDLLRDEWDLVARGGSLIVIARPGGASSTYRRAEERFSVVAQ